MITVLILLIFLVGASIYRGMNSSEKSLPLYIQYKKTIILLAMAIVPVLIMNVFHQDPSRYGSKKYIELGGEELSYLSREKAYEHAMLLAPNDLELRFDYIDFATQYEVFDPMKFANYPYSPIDEIHDQSVAYFYAQHLSVHDEEVVAHFEKLSEKSPYSNYILGINWFRHNKPEKARKYFLKEIKVQPEFDGAYNYLYQLSNFHFPEDAKKYLDDFSFSSHLSFHTQRRHYFTTGQVLKYLRAITLRSFDDLQFMAFFAALIISIVWMLFLRSMDVFNMEKWRDLIIVFLLGGALTHICLIGYDLARFHFDFHINGEAWNDFWYCVLVIGGSEELVKFIPWIAFIYLARKAKEPYDYILYASISALGFAFVENLSYLEDPGNIVGRSIMSTIGHMFDASVIAYAFILVRYRVKSKVWKIALPFIGFAVACLVHGFYDFWLISPAFNNFGFVTAIFFVATMHMWFIMLNNAVNNSPFYKRSMFNSTVQLDIVTFGIIGILMIEYAIQAWDFGAGWANQSIARHGWMVLIFLSYMTAILLKMKIISGRWRKYRFVLPTGVGQYFRFSGPSKFQVPEAPNYEGLELRLFVQKSNRFVSGIFPVSGTISRNIELSQSDKWHLFQLNKPLDYAGYRTDYVIIRPKNDDESLETDKVEIVLLFIPVHVDIFKGDWRVEDMRYTGRAFTRPV